MVTKELLHELFEYKEGDLIRKTSLPNKVKKGDVAGNLNQTGYVSTKINNKPYYNHRLVWLMHHGSLPRNIDHIDGDKTNNKIENLRASTPSQNSCNRKTPMDNKSGVKGVIWRKNRWHARIGIGRKRIHIGCFETIEEASIAVMNKRNELHGEYANHD